MLAESGRSVVEVQDGGRRLDDVPTALRTAEAVVPGQTEVLVAAAAIRQLKHLTGNHRLLLGHTGGRGGQKRIVNLLAINSNNVFVQRHTGSTHDLCNLFSANFWNCQELHRIRVRASETSIYIHTVPFLKLFLHLSVC